MTIRPTQPLFLLLFAALSPLFVRAAHAGESHRYEEVGYRIRLPDDFSLQSRNSRAADPYLLETFRCSRPLRTRRGSAFTERLYTYWFPTRTAADVARAAEADGGKGGKGRIFTSFRDYAEDRIQGFFFGGEKEVSVAGFPATLLEMQFEKLTGTPRRYLACTFSVAGGEFAMMFSCTEEHLRQRRDSYQNCFSSLRITAEEGLRLPAERAGAQSGSKAEKAPLEELSPEQLVALRDEAFGKAIDGLEKGWRHHRSEHFLVLYRTEPGHAKKVARQGEALWSWLSDRLAPVGMDYVQDMVVRVARSEDGPERHKQARPALEPNARIGMVSISRPDRTRSGRELSQLNRGVVGHWLSQRNAVLSRRLPLWLVFSLGEIIEDARLSGGGLSFDMDVGERRGVVTLLKARDDYRRSKKGADPILPLVEVIGPGSHARFRNRSNSHGVNRQANLLMRYLLIGPGARNARTEMVLQHYLGHLGELVIELEATLEKEKEEKAALEMRKEEMTDEQRLEAEDREYQKRRERGPDQIAEELVSNAFRLTFEGWTENDWNDLDRAVLAYARKLSR